MLQRTVNYNCRVANYGIVYLFSCFRREKSIYNAQQCRGFIIYCNIIEFY